MSGNDNQPQGGRTLWSGTDPHGQAAMLLVESLLHGLVARSLISVDDAIEMIDVAADVQAEIGADGGDNPDVVQTSVQLLAAMRASLTTDLAIDGKR